MKSVYNIPFTPYKPRVNKSERVSVNVNISETPADAIQMPDYSHTKAQFNQVSETSAKSKKKAK